MCSQGVTPVTGLRTWKGKRELERGWPSQWSCVGPHSDVKPCLSMVRNEECLHTSSHRCQRRSFVEHCLFVDLPRSGMVLCLQIEGSGRSEQRLFLLVIRERAHSAVRQQRTEALLRRGKTIRHVRRPIGKRTCHECVTSGRARPARSVS